MGLLLDLTPEGRELPPATDAAPDHTPSDLEMLGRGLLGVPRYPLRVLRSLPAAVPNLDETAFATLPGAGTLGRLAGGLERVVRRDGPGVVRTSYRAPKTSFNGRVSPHRRFVFGQLPLDD